MLRLIKAMFSGDWAAQVYVQGPSSRIARIKSAARAVAPRTIAARFMLVLSRLAATDRSEGIEEKLRCAGPGLIAASARAISGARSLSQARVINSSPNTMNATIAWSSRRRKRVLHALQLRAGSQQKIKG